MWVFINPGILRQVSNFIKLSKAKGKKGVTATDSSGLEEETQLTTKQVQQLRQYLQTIGKGLCMPNTTMQACMCTCHAFGRAATCFAK